MTRTIDNDEDDDPVVQIITHVHLVLVLPQEQVQYSRFLQSRPAILENQLQRPALPRLVVVVRVGSTSPRQEQVNMMMMMMIQTRRVAAISS
jgi:hypothetical protein